MTILIEKKLTFFLLAISFTTPFVCGLKFNGITGLSQQSYHYPTATNLLQSTGSCFCANRCNFRRYRHLSASTNPPQSSSYGDDTAGGGGKSIGTESQLKEYANNLGIIVSLTTLGPGYRSVARAAHDEEQILGYCEGFIRPGTFFSSNMMNLIYHPYNRCISFFCQGFTPRSAFCCCRCWNKLSLQKLNMKC